jgi:hypothetical protein
VSIPDDPIADVAWLLLQIDGDDRLQEEVTLADVLLSDDVRNILEEESTSVWHTALEGDNPGSLGVYRWRGRYVIMGSHDVPIYGPYTDLHAAVVMSCGTLHESGGMVVDISGEKCEHWIPIVAGDDEDGAVALYVRGVPCVLQRDASGRWTWPPAREGDRVVGPEQTRVLMNGHWIPERT